MSENTSDRLRNGSEDATAGILGVPEILCTRFVRKPGKRGIRRILGILSISNLSVFSADVGFDSRRLHQLLSSKRIGLFNRIETIPSLASIRPFDWNRPIDLRHLQAVPRPDKKPPDAGGGPYSSKSFPCCSFLNLPLFKSLSAISFRVFPVMMLLGAS